MIELGNDKKKFFEAVTKELAEKFIADEKNGLCKYTCRAVIDFHLREFASHYASIAIMQRGWKYTNAKQSIFSMSTNSILKRVYELVHENWKKENDV